MIGRRLELLANNTKVSHILTLFSAEASTIDPTFNYHGDYLWFNGLNPPLPFLSGSTEDVNTNFLTNYNSSDPYYSACNGATSVPTCALPNTSPICNCT